MNARVCILTAGKGSRLNQRTAFFNKSLLKCGDKAIISHQIDWFDRDTTFVIALGYMGSQVRQYLEIAHPDTHFIFVDIDKYSVPGSGPGYAMQKCRQHLQQPFYFLACDTLVSDFEFKATDYNWVGYDKVAHGTQKNYCILDIMHCDCCINAFHDKQSDCSASQTDAFIGFANVIDHDKFWRSFDKTCAAATAGNEIQIAPAFLTYDAEGWLDPTPEKFTWYDVGTEEGLLKARHAYEGRLNLDKPDEEIYFLDGKVVKYFHNAEIAASRVVRTQCLPFTPKITQRSHNFYAYDFIQGKDMFQRGEPEKHLQRLLDIMEERVWERHARTADFERACEQFYYVKTHKRLRQIAFQDKEEIINNIVTPPVLSLLERIDWPSLVSDGVPANFHGDFQLSNVIMGDDGAFTLIDWRQDFGGNHVVGDVYYDLAKMNACFVMPHDSVKAGQYSVTEHKGEILVDIVRSASVQKCQRIFVQWQRANGYNERRTHLLTYLALLNMAPLHESPLDKWLYYTAKHGLTQILGD